MDKSPFLFTFAVAFSVAGQPDFGLQEGANSKEKAANTNIITFEYTFLVFIIVDYIRFKKQQKNGKDCPKPLFFKAFFPQGVAYVLHSLYFCTQSFN